MMQLKKRILVCGGRDYHDREHVNKTLDNLRQWFTADFVIIQGEANGADLWGKRWGKRQGRPVIGVEAPWDFYNKAAGNIRNGWMLTFCEPDLVVAFPGGSGTADMITQARRAGVDVYEG